ncbi:hypothetical protein TWF281_004215 [Arthrobotrys megalospora]
MMAEEAEALKKRSRKRKAPPSPPTTDDEADDGNDKAAPTAAVARGRRPTKRQKMAAGPPAGTAARIQYLLDLHEWRNPQNKPRRNDAGPLVGPQVRGAGRHPPLALPAPPESPSPTNIPDINLWGGTLGSSSSVVLPILGPHLARASSSATTGAGPQAHHQGEGPP